MKTIKQKGFGLIPVLLVLILVSVVGATGYYVYNQQTNKKTDKSEVAGNSSTKTTPTPSPIASATPTTTTQPDSQKYLVIKEWGVKIPLSETMLATTYKYETTNNIELVTLSIPDAKVTPCSWSYTIAKASKPYVDGDPVGAQEPINLGKINNTYYLGEKVDSPSICLGNLSPEEVAKKYGISNIESRDNYINKLIEISKKIQAQ